MAAVEPRVDDGDANRVEHGQLGRKSVERMVLRQVVLPRSERIGRREARLQRQGKGGGR